MSSAGDIEDDDMTRDKKNIKASHHFYQKKTPLRPFPAPAKVIDLTSDVYYENKWEPIMPIEERIPEDEKDPEEKYEYIYDRRTIDRGLFEAF